MSKKTTTAKIRSDGTVVEVLADGTERPFPDTPVRPMTEAEIEAAAADRSVPDT
jgi:putative transcriptional regulator